MKEEEHSAMQLDYQILQEQSKQLNKELALFDQQIRIMESLNKSLDSLKTAKKDSEVFSEIGSGIFVKTALRSTNEVLINTGANVAVVKPIEEAKLMVEDQIKQLREAIIKTGIELQNCAFQAQILRQKLLAEEKNHKH